MRVLMDRVDGGRPTLQPTTPQPTPPTHSTTTHAGYMAQLSRRVRYVLMGCGLGVWKGVVGCGQGAERGVEHGMAGGSLGGDDATRSTLKWTATSWAGGWVDGWACKRVGCMECVGWCGSRIGWRVVGGRLVGVGAICPATSWAGGWVGGRWVMGGWVGDGCSGDGWLCLRIHPTFRISLHHHSTTHPPLVTAPITRLHSKAPRRSTSSPLLSSQAQRARIQRGRPSRGRSLASMPCWAGVAAVAAVSA